jgi:hypothetical protein
MVQGAGARKVLKPDAWTQRGLSSLLAWGLPLIAAAAKRVIRSALGM